MTRIAFLDTWSPAVRDEVRRVAPPAFDLVFAESYDAAHQHTLVADADGVVPGFAKVDAALVQAAPRLRMVQKWGIGIDAIDLDVLRRRGIALAIAAGSNAKPVAELTVALMLAVYRRIPYCDQAMRQGRWPTPEMRQTCFQIGGKTVGLIGFGAIGRMVAQRLAGFDAHIVYFDPQRVDAATQDRLRATPLALDDLLATSDIVSLHLPLAPATSHLIDAGTITRMKDGAVLINTARGGLIDEAALADALRSGKLRGAGLDAFAHEPPPLDHPLLAPDLNVVVTPHVGGGVFDNVAPVAQHVFGNLQRFLRGEALPDADVVIAPPTTAGAVA
jgi:D-3-phosphoglycerate dehydrogenase